MNTRNEEKRILLVNPAKPDNFAVTRIHLGLSLLGGILARAGHQIKVVDYAYLRWLQSSMEVPPVRQIIREFRPDVVGISVFTYQYDVCQEMIADVAECSEAPIVLGGPHFAVFPDDFAEDGRVSCIVRGEAEEVIRDLVLTVEKKDKPRIIDCEFPDAESIPFPDLSLALGSDHLSDYQIQLSRGCPYQCSFCNICYVGGKKARARNLEVCISEIVEAKTKHSHMKRIVITDDCPAFDPRRFKRFLKLLCEKQLSCELHIDNIRADTIDEDFLQLYAAAGGKNICLGVESGNQEVFGAIQKGESLEQIEAAARMVKKHGLMLGCCFVIGLPEDTLERHRSSIEMARRMQPSYVFWNMCLPWPGTRAYDWFRANGDIRDPRNISTLVDKRAQFLQPVASSPEFTVQERVAAWLGANMEMRGYFDDPHDLFRITKLAVRYKIYEPWGAYFKGSFLPALGKELGFLLRGIRQKAESFIRRVLRC